MKKYTLSKLYDDSFKKDILDIIKQGMPENAIYSSKVKPPENAQIYTTDRGTEYWIPSKKDTSEVKQPAKQSVGTKNLEQFKVANKKLSAVRKTVLKNKDVRHYTDGYDSIAMTSGVHHHTPLANPEFTLTFKDGSTMQMSAYMNNAIDYIVTREKSSFRDKKLVGKLRNPDNFKTKEDFIKLMDEELDQPLSLTTKSGWNYRSEKLKNDIKAQRNERPMSIKEIFNSYISEEDVLSDAEKQKRGNKLISNVEKIANTDKPLPDMDIDTKTAKDVIEIYNNLPDESVKLFLSLPLNQMIESMEYGKVSGSYVPSESKLNRKESYRSKKKYQQYRLTGTNEEERKFHRRMAEKYRKLNPLSQARLK